MKFQELFLLFYLFCLVSASGCVEGRRSEIIYDDDFEDCTEDLSCLPPPSDADVGDSDDDPEGDSDVATPFPVCSQDGFCNPECNGTDPDCHGQICEEDGVCNLDCPVDADPDCTGDKCGQDQQCNLDCPADQDPDCQAYICGEVNFFCNPMCAIDPDCEEVPCESDGQCSLSCVPGADPDCGPMECKFDRRCNSLCEPETDADCGELGCESDDRCNPDCHGDDPDCVQGFITDHSSQDQ